MNSARRKCSQCLNNSAKAIAATIEGAISKAVTWPSRSFSPGAGLEAPQRRKQGKAEQRGDADDEAERKGPEAAAARFLLGDNRRRGGDQRMLALDDAAGDVVCDGLNDAGDVVGFGDHDAA